MAIIAAMTVTHDHAGDLIALALVSILVALVAFIVIGLVASLWRASAPLAVPPETWQTRWKRKFVADLRAIVADDTCEVDQNRTFSRHENGRRRASLLGLYLSDGDQLGDRAWLCIDYAGDNVGRWWFQVDGHPEKFGDTTDGYIDNAVRRIAEYTGLPPEGLGQLLRPWTAAEAKHIHSSTTNETLRLLATRRIDRFAYGSEPRLPPPVT